jgi:hypothetical protein
MRCDALKRHAQPPIPTTGLFLSKWLKRGGGSLNRGQALRAVEVTFRFQNQTEAIKEGLKSAPDAGEVVYQFPSN